MFWFLYPYFVIFPLHVSIQQPFPHPSFSYQCSVLHPPLTGPPMYCLPFTHSYFPIIPTPIYSLLSWFLHILIDFTFFSLNTCSHHSECPLEGCIPGPPSSSIHATLSKCWLFICPDDGGSRIYYNICNIPPTYMVLHPKQSCCHRTAMITLHLHKSFYVLSCCTSCLSITSSPLNLATLRNSSNNICTYPESHRGVLCQLRHINGKFPQQLE
jgi:hypothetical protein